MWAGTLTYLQGIWSHFRLVCGPSHLALWSATDSEAIAAIVRITGGNFRLLQRLFAQIGRLLTLNGLHTLTKEVVEAARECLIIGTT